MPKFQKGHKINLGKHWKLSEITKEKMRKPHIGSGVYIRTQEHKDKLKGKAKVLGKHWKIKDTSNMGQHLKGKRSPFWKGGITDKNHQIRNSREYRLWRRAVFERDNYTCIWCGRIGGKLNADHIKSFSDYPELRFAIDNGRTLCLDCHKKTNTYLNHKNK